MSFLSNCTSYSVSSGLLAEITQFRNHPGYTPQLIAELFYACSTVIAIAESVIAVVATVLSIPMFPIDPCLFKRSYAWLKSASFSIALGSTFTLFNLFVPRFVPYPNQLNHSTNQSTKLNIQV